MSRVAVIVVMYNPKEYMLDNLMNYKDLSLIIIDNSDDSNDISKHVKKMDCVYKPLGKNMGLAYALNEGVNIAYEKGCKYVLTLDQDSIIENSDISKMVDFLDIHDEIAVLSPTIIPYEDIDNIPRMKSIDNSYSSVNFVITSGCLCRKEIYENVGYFRDELFIEYIDVDFCLRLKKQGIKIIRLNEVHLYQRAGNSVEKRFLWKKIHPLFDSPKRGYYIFRNHKYLKKIYGRNLYKYAPRLYKAIIKTLFYEDRKIERVRFYIEGYIDGCRGQMGEYRK